MITGEMKKLNIDSPLSRKPKKRYGNKLNETSIVPVSMDGPTEDPTHETTKN